MYSDAPNALFHSQPVPEAGMTRSPSDLSIICAEYTHQLCFGFIGNGVGREGFRMPIDVLQIDEDFYDVRNVVFEPLLYKAKSAPFRFVTFQRPRALSSTGSPLALNDVRGTHLD